MNGLNILIVGEAPRADLAALFARCGHDVTRVDRGSAGSPRCGAWDVVVVDAGEGAVNHRDVARVRSGFNRPVLVVAEQPANLSSIDGAVFCFSDASDEGHDLALRMCVALTSLVVKEPSPRLPLCRVVGQPLDPGSWRRRARGRAVISRAAVSQ